MILRKNIAILATGGTIAGSGFAANSSKYSSAQISIENLIPTISGINKLANISGEQLLSVGSQNIDDGAWLKISKRVNGLLGQSNVDGVVVAHGTDTLEETAYFLNLTVKSSKPVVMVGSMRPSTALGADGAINLYNAVALATDAQAHNKGVLVVMADKIFAARDVSKINASSIEAFAAPNCSAIGHIHYGKAQIYYQPLRIHTSKSQFDVDNVPSLPKVDIIYMHSEFDDNIIDFLVESQTKAIVLASFGDGNVSENVLQKLISAREKGVLIIKSSRSGAGFVEANIEIDDDKHGFVAADNLNPQKARILTKLALTKIENLTKIKEIFTNY